MKKNKKDESNVEEATGVSAPVGKRIGHNSIYMVIRTVLIMIVSLYTSRLALQLLGETDFGIYSVVAGFVIFFGFLNGSMERSVTRFLLYERGSGTQASLQRMFNVSMIAQLCIVGVVLIVGETVGLWYVNHQLNVPADKMGVTNWVYQLSLLTLCVNIVKVPYNAMIIAFEKMSFYAFFAMGEVILRLICILSLLLLKDNLLVMYAGQFLAVTIVVVAVYKIYCTHAHVFGNVCRFKWLWQRDWFKNILSFCGWSTLGSMAALGALQGVSLILNHFYGVIVNSAFGLAVMVQSAIFSILVSFQTAFSPKLVSLYAQGNISQLRGFIYKLGKYSFYLAAILLVPLCINIDTVLQVWLGDEVPKYTGIFCVLCMVSNGIDCLAAPGLVCNQATGKVRNFNIIWSIMLLCNLPLSWICVNITDWAPAAFVIRVVMTFLIYLFIIIVMRVQIRIRFWRYFADSMLKPALLASIPILVAWWINTITGPGILQAFFNSLLFWLFFVIAILRLGLTHDERKKVYSKALSKIPALRRFNRYNCL